MIVGCTPVSAPMLGILSGVMHDRREAPMRRPSTPMMLSLVALFFALGGTAIAAKHYLITSTSQIKPSVLKQLHGKAGPPGPAGANGAAGAPGPGGPQGPAGPSNLSPITLVEGPKNTIPAESIEGSLVFCPSGQHALSGGGTQITGKP